MSGRLRIIHISVNTHSTKKGLIISRNRDFIYKKITKKGRKALLFTDTEETPPHAIARKEPITNERRDWCVFVGGDIETSQPANSLYTVPTLEFVLFRAVPQAFDIFFLGVRLIFFFLSEKRKFNLNPIMDILSFFLTLLFSTIFA